MAKRSEIGLVYLAGLVPGGQFHFYQSATPRLWVQ
jgi:hypothetical protein